MNYPGYMKQVKPYWSIILVLAAAKFVLPFILQSPVYELHRDEYLYYEQGQHFALGYLENPPLLSWLGMISSWLGGSSFWIKFWPCLFGAFTVIITCLLTAELGGKAFAQFIAGFSILGGAYMRMFFLFQPNAPEIFFWTLSIYFLVRFIKNKERRFLFAFVISISLSWWSKYSVAFLVAAIFIALLFSAHRLIFLKKQTYAALLLGLILILPNIAWQYYHKWPLVHHMRELQDRQLQFLSPLDFIKDQLLYLVPVVFIWIAGLIWLFKNKQWRFIFWAYLFVIILLLIGRGKSYYSMGIYPSLLAAGAVAWENFSSKKIWLRYAVVTLITFLVVLFIPMLLPVYKPQELAAFYKKYDLEKTGLLKWEDQDNHPLPQDFADMIGWNEVARQTAKVYQQLPENEKIKTVVKADNYGLCGALNYYGRNYGLPEVYGYNGSFLLWMPDTFNITNVITVGEEFPDTSRAIVKQFQRISIEGELKDSLARQNGTKIILWRGCDPDSLSKFIKEEIRERKEFFTRE
jgi:dolichyl-phosphate-mannose-protein mannosyltransferase